MSELIRASISGGTCCCRVVPKKVLDSEAPAPQANAAAPTQSAVACRAIGMSGSA